MNHRISKKIYKRADSKLKAFIAANHDKRTTYDIAKEENILSGLERSIFIAKQDKWAKRINGIVDELKTEEQTISRNEYHWNLERCVTCLVDTPTLQELLNRRKENHATSIIVSTRNNKDLFKGDVSGLPEELLNIPIFSWNKRNGTYITIE
ncbi:hypothetical protein [Roseburia inulinivorans]